MGALVADRRNNVDYGTTVRVQLRIPSLHPLAGSDSNSVDYAKAVSPDCMP